ncbi:MAG: hypothetical protein AAFX08_06480 [Pseudomonadota bacterium]
MAVFEGVAAASAISASTQWIASFAASAGDAPTAASSLGATRGMLLGGAVLAPLTLFIIGAAARNATASIGGALAALVACRLAIGLGLVPAPAGTLVTLINAGAGATLLVFVSAVLTSARESAALGAVLFAGALSLLGIGVINLFVGGQAAGLVTIGCGASFAFAIGLAAHALARADVGGAFLAPGVVVGALGGLAAFAGGGLALAGATASVLAVVAASVAGCLRDAAVSRLALAGDLDRRGGADVAAFGAAPLAKDASRQKSSAKAGQSEEAGEDAELAQALDYVGLAVWDWSVARCRQTQSFGDLMGADGSGAFTPDAMRAFIGPDAIADFDRQVLGRGLGDGAFDWTGDLVNGKRVRMRGARAVDPKGALERIVLFLEAAPGVAAAEGAAAADASGVVDEAAKSATGRAAAGKPANAPSEKDPAEKSETNASLLSTAAASLAGVAASASQSSADEKASEQGRDGDPAERPKSNAKDGKDLKTQGSSANAALSDVAPSAAGSKNASASASDVAPAGTASASQKKSPRKNPFRRGGAVLASGEGVKRIDGRASAESPMPAPAASIGADAGAASKSREAAPSADAAGPGTDGRRISPDERLAAERPIGRARRMRQRSRILI